MIVVPSIEMILQALYELDVPSASRNQSIDIVYNIERVCPLIACSGEASNSQLQAQGVTFGYQL